MSKILEQLPDEIQRIIFSYISHPNADIIKNINKIVQLHRHIKKERKDHLLNRPYGNVFGRYDLTTYKVVERNNNFHTFEYWLRQKTMNSFGLCEDMKTKNELVKYCFLNGIDKKNKRFNVNWNKKKIINCILKADI